MPWFFLCYFVAFYQTTKRTKRQFDIKMCIFAIQTWPKIYLYECVCVSYSHSQNNKVIFHLVKRKQKVRYKAEALRQWHAESASENENTHNNKYKQTIILALFFSHCFRMFLLFHLLAFALKLSNANRWNCARKPQISINLLV